MWLQKASLFSIVYHLEQNKLRLKRSKNICCICWNFNLSKQNSMTFPNPKYVSLRNSINQTLEFVMDYICLNVFVRNTNLIVRFFKYDKGLFINDTMGKGVKKPYDIIDRQS